MKKKKTACITMRKHLKNDDDFSCMKCPHSFRTENKLKCHENVCKNEDFCAIVWPSQNKSILKFNQNMKSQNMKSDKNHMYNLCRSWIFH